MGGAALSAAGLVALAGVATPAAAKPAHRRTAAHDTHAQDAELLNAAMALEHEGIAAYDIGLGSGLIPSTSVPLVTTIQDHHKSHRDELAKAITRLGGRPVEAESKDHYVKALNAASITQLRDIQMLAFRLERGAASAYLGLIKPLGDSDLHLLVAGLAADEAAHATIFMLDLKESLPRPAHMFG
jgi:rubrerythrin